MTAKPPRRSGLEAAGDAGARILRAVREIPPGLVATYGDIARRAGLPRGARMVGRVLARLPRDTDVPWHRVVLAGGRLPAFADPDGCREHQRRLAAEGLVVVDGRIADPPHAFREDDPRIWDEWGLRPAAPGRGAVKPASDRAQGPESRGSGSRRRPRNTRT
ncbi:MGMT family protein [bacterium]|nr:MGMT family protein [bacterium]